MNRICIAFIGLALLACCSDKPKTPGSGNPAANYGDAMIDSYQKGRQAGVGGDLDAVRKTIAAFHAANDRYPETLDEIRPIIGTELDMSKYDYNPLTGGVTLRAN